MERLRGLIYAPVWMVVVAVVAALWGFAAVTGFSEFGIYVVPAAGSLLHATSTREGRSG